jgi:hypothetical protein
MILLLVAAAVVVAAPIVAAVLVTIASLREDSARSLTGRPPGPLAAAARRLLCLRTNADNYAGRPAGPPRSGQHLPSEAHPEIPLPRSDADQTLTLPRS